MPNHDQRPGSLRTVTTSGEAVSRQRERIDLEASVRRNVIPLLQSTLADAIDLFTQIKQAHWNVKGPGFIALHELFDAVAEIVEEHGDVLAERIASLGGRPDGTARAVAAQSSLAEYPVGIVDGREHVAAVADRLAAFAATLRAAIDRSAEYGDAVSADVFTELCRAIDKQRWFVEAHLDQES